MILRWWLSFANTVQMPGLIFKRVTFSGVEVCPSENEAQMYNLFACIIYV
jgi:hypothetical protein